MAFIFSIPLKAKNQFNKVKNEAKLVGQYLASLIASNTLFPN